MHPSVVFAVARYEPDGQLKHWKAFRDHVEAIRPLIGPMQGDRAVVGPAPTAHGEAVTYWRLLALNHRELARSYWLYNSVARATTHLELLLTELDAFAVHPFTGDRAGMHGWFATVRDRPVMTCSRWYGGRTAAIAAGNSSLAALRTAADWAALGGVPIEVGGGLAPAQSFEPAAAPGQRSELPPRVLLR